MKIELTYYDRWIFSFEPETELEECALEYLADRPQDEVIVQNTRLGVFKRTEKEE